MADGYTRQSSADIVTSNTIEASHFNNEFNALQTAFSATTGHNHDGTAGGGAPIPPGGLVGLSSNGVVVRVDSTTFAARTLTAPAAGITITNPAGTAGNPTFALANDLAALEALASTGIAVRTTTDTWAQRQIVAPAAGITITNPAGTAGNPTFALADDLAALEGLAANGYAVRTGTNTWAQRAVTVSGEGLSVANATGSAGDTTISLADDMALIEALTGPGILCRSGSDTWALRTLTAPAAGITVSFGTGATGNPTLALANDLAALEGLASTGIAVRTGADTWDQRQIVGTTNEVAVTNGTGVSGNPTISLPTALIFTGKTVTGGTLTGNTISAITLSGTTGDIPTTQTYTPTLTNVTNVASSTASTLFYQRVHNWVNVSGRVSITATAANTETVLGMSLPIASNFTSPEQAGGTFGSNTSGHSRCGTTTADLTNDRFNLRIFVESTSATVYYFTFSYRIL